MIAQTPHTFSGIEVALLDLLAKKKLSNLFFIGMKKIIQKLLMPQYCLEKHLKILLSNKKFKTKYFEGK